MRGRVYWALAVASAVTVAACSEKLAGPADCPALCPGGSAVALDTVLSPLGGLDSVYPGYISATASQAVLATNALPAIDARAVYKFTKRPDSVSVAGPRAYVIDSIAFTFGLLARDTLTTGIGLRLFRLPATIDSTTNFAAVTSADTPANLIATFSVPDSVKPGGLVRILLVGPVLNQLVIPAADSGVLAIGIGVDATTPTGVRLTGAAVTTNPPTFVTYVTAAGVDTSVGRTSISQLLTFSTWVAPPLPPPPPDALVLGDVPSSRSILRFRLTPFLRDSATIVRATLELLPQQPVLGLNNSPTRVIARPVLSDLGAKSPLDNTALNAGFTDVVNGFADTIRVEIAQSVRGWQGPAGRNQAVILGVTPEGASFGRPIVSSTRSATGQPRLRITYLKVFPFERP